MSNEETKADCVRNVVTLKDLALSAKSELEQEASHRAVAILKAKQIEISKARTALNALESQYSQLCLMTLEEFAAKEPGYSLGCFSFADSHRAAIKSAFEQTIRSVCVGEKGL